MNAQQLVFSRVLDEAAEADERRRRLALDSHRQCVQIWFDELAPMTFASSQRNT